MLKLVGYGVLGVTVLLMFFRGARWGLFGLVWYDHLRLNDQLESDDGVGQLLYWEHIPFSLVLTALVLGALVLLAQRYRFTMDRFHWAVLVFFLTALSSSLFAPCFGPAAGRVDDYFKCILQYYVICAFIRDERELRQLFWAEASVMIPVALYFCYTKFVRGGHLWEGATGDRNEMSMAMVMATPLLIILGFTAKTRLTRTLSWGAIVPMALTVLFDGSRGGMLGLGAVLSYLLFRLRNKRWLIVVALCFLPVGGYFVPPEVVARFTSIGTAAQTDPSAMGRVHAWAVAREILRNRPLTGMGVGNFLVDFKYYARAVGNDPEDVHVAHSSFYQIMGDQGYPGLFAWFYLVAMLWLVASWVELRAARMDHGTWTETRYFLVAVKSAWIGYVLCGAFLSQDLNDYFFHLLAITSRYAVFMDRREDVVRGARARAEIAARKAAYDKRMRELAAQGIIVPA